MCFSSIDLSQQDKRRQRRRKEPRIDYDTDSHIFHISNPTRKSSHV
jgi:hypothetical protein